MVSRKLFNILMKFQNSHTNFIREKRWFFFLNKHNDGRYKF